MKIVYDPVVDVLSILLVLTPTSASQTFLSDLQIDYDLDGNVVKLEILNAKERVNNPQTVEYSVNLTAFETQSTDDSTPIGIRKRRAFLKLPIAQRRRLLAQQASDMVDHYQQNTDWKEFLAGDIIDY
ncbi:hypothetical protein PCC7424_5547 (plasmid) [Gloeothece citriformis PCC 7424]|uniref:DUF2283 domain-containing protein n=1 Tax=Gloeothece citriformis (strain PCC 7424) TaxID=65393 RepID=B7KMU1_GLOC7|nr:DUF2283 domain-containing protein [Gloeothece citriformis]ACK74113.1 hypothetical protein PCC7424_5547 [Gloeothece citriformis PCC 7424]